MRINILLTGTAAIYGLVGLGLLFAPDELLAAIGAPASVPVSWLVQAFGTALLGLAFMNWFQRYTRTEGILGRPVLVPNLFFVATSFWLALSAWRRSQSEILLACALVLGALSVAFGWRLLARHPAPPPADG